MQMLYEETRGEAIITTGVGQHQMWAAQWYKYNEPRRWVSSGGLGSMGFGLPSAIGAAVAFDGTDNGRCKRVRVKTCPIPVCRNCCGVSHNSCGVRRSHGQAGLVSELHRAQLAIRRRRCCRI